MQANDIFNNSIKSRKSDIDFAKKRLADLRKARKVLMPYIKHIAPLVGEHDYVNLGSSMSYCSINVTMNKLDGFKDTRLEQMLYVMMCFKDVEASDTDEFAEWLSRTYRFTVKTGDIEVLLNVEANVKNDSQTCRKIRVGEKMEVIAEYAIQCD